MSVTRSASFMRFAGLKSTKAKHIANGDYVAKVIIQSIARTRRDMHIAFRITVLRKTSTNQPANSVVRPGHKRVTRATSKLARCRTNRETSVRQFEKRVSHQMNPRSNIGIRVA